MLLFRRQNGRGVVMPLFPDNKILTDKEIMDWVDMAAFIGGKSGRIIAKKEAVFVINAKNKQVAAAVKELREKMVQLLPTGRLYPEKYVRKNDVLALIDAVFGAEGKRE